MSYQLEMYFVTFSLMVDLQIRVFTGGGMGCFQLVSSIKVSLLIKAFCLRGRFLVFVYRVSRKNNNIKFARLWTLLGILEMLQRGRWAQKGPK